MYQAPSFIEEYKISSEICQKVITAFEEHPELQRPGSIGGIVVDPSRKESTDLVLNNLEELFHSYFSELVVFIKDYCKKYKLVQDEYPMSFFESTNVQRYLPEQGFFKEHHERGGNGVALNRELVFMTYLNTIDDFSENQGATIFPLQNQFVRPEIGKTLIWPAGFTHRHYGVPHKSETKYIITGWKHLIQLQS